MEQLIGMGFSPELATQALAATGSNSTVEQATEWILTHSTPTPSPSPSSTAIQPSLDRFFPSTTTKNPPPSQSQSQSQSQPLPKRAKPSKPLSPLPDRMRPSTLDQILGQDHLLSLLRSSLSSHSHLPSLLLWGPPGCGKTSLARAISSSLPSSPPHRFLSLSAVSAAVKDLRDAIHDARRLLRLSQARTVLFVDEVHRFSKSQQDSLLPAIEDGSVVFLGATTENPSFHLTTPLLSRSRVLSLHPLHADHIRSLIRNAVDDTDRGLCLATRMPVSIDEESLSFLAVHCDGDARVALNALEVAATLAVNQQLSGVGDDDRVTICIGNVKEAMQCKHLAYDRDGEEHYNLISALHKSMRGSDPDAAIYWLARMLEGGEKPLYIARRLVRFASEDVGLADPAALGHAVACYQACHFLGMPECDVNLAQCVAYLALAPKSVAVYRALGEAKRAVKESVGGNEGVPLHLRNAPTKLMKEFGYGEGYIYPPDHAEAASLQTYMPPSLQGRKFLDWPPHEEKPQ